MTFEELQDLLAEQFSCDSGELERGVSLADLGADHEDMVELAWGLGEAVGAEIDEAAAYQAARLCGLNMLRTIQAYIGSLDRVDYFVKALGLVNSAGNFYNMPAVMNGYSDLMVEIFGHRGQHARAAMGAYVLPGNMPVSVDAIVKIRR